MNRLHTAPTRCGRKASIALEGLGLPCDLPAPERVNRRAVVVRLERIAERPAVARGMAVPG